MNIQEFLNNPLHTPVISPDPVLKTVCQKIEDLEPWKQITSIMIDVMNNSNGIGLAAPQIGLPYKAFVIQTTKTMTFINPEILEYGDRMAEYEEGCLSLPNVRVKVKRPTKIKIKWQELDGKEKVATFEGLTSRVIQHEYDHLFGKLIND